MSTVVVNGLAMDGYPWRVRKNDALNGVGVRTPSGDRAGADGEWAGTSLRAARSFTLEGLYKGADPITVDAAHTQLLEAIALADIPVTTYRPAGPRTVLARRAGEVIWEWLGGDVVRWSALLKAHDPNVYLGDGTTPAWTGVTGRATEVGGVDFPLGFTPPLLWDSAVVGGQVAYRNPGTTGKLELRLDGPLVDPVVTTYNADGVRVLSWAGLTLPAGAWLEIDPVRRQALLQGQASRPPTRRGWPRLTPGQNTFGFHASGDSTGTLTVRAWPAL